DDTAALTTALQDLEPYAWQRTVDTQIHYPPIVGSKTSVTVNAQSLPLGYDAANSVVRSQMEVTTEDFKTGGAPSTAMQLVFPHHRAAMIGADTANIPQANGAARYTWRSVNGELQAYVGNSYVRELTAYGVLPFMPGVAYEERDAGPDASAAQDVYERLKTWFYQAEPNVGGTPGPFVRNIGTYFPFQNNTYAPNLAGIYENLAIADQLAQSPHLSDVDTDLEKSKNAVAADMRDFSLASLKEVVGRWADPYTSGVFQYNSEFDTLYGQPEGYGSVQNLNDKHFHWSYFLRAAAAIGRYDEAWVQAYRCSPR
ncbi:MAG: glycosyl hydrolase, partial [Pseudonocardiaceae bacterium]